VNERVNEDRANHASAPTDDTPDLERRFGGLRRLYGSSAYEHLRALRVAVVGLGGVGSWAVEALARSGVAELVLIDMDHVAESNINRQIQALGATLGMAKGLALAQRVADIHPGCKVHVIDDFVEAANWPGLLPGPVDALIDACDQVRAKAAMAAWALQERVPLVCCGAAGGKRHAERLVVADLAAVTHDPLLASLRHRLRREHGAAKAGQGSIGVRCVFSRETVASPADAACNADGSSEARDSSLNCHGYGSAVTVTASFGFAAAGEAISLCLQRHASSQSRKSGVMI
jgi:tRNA A37 threonylcarbamoyladenosine dehydratase